MIRDFTGDKGRAILMLIATTVGIFGVAAILSTYSILSREVTRNYMDTNPASATLDVGEVNKDILNIVRNFPGMADVEARSVITARVKIGEDWRHMLFFVVEDFEHLKLNTFQKLSGAWPPPTGTMLIERTVQRLIDQTTGGSVVIRMESGQETTVPITGIVHDGTLAPAWQDQTGYGYITLDTLGLLGGESVLEEVRIQFEGNPSDITFVEEQTQALATVLRQQGHSVHELRVPPPRTHPHQTQIMGVLFLLFAFAGMAFFLGAVLVATIIAALLTRQIREIGVMKTVGARSGQIAYMYISMLMGVGLLSVLIGLPAGLFAAKMLVNMVAELLNLTILSYAVSPWVYAVLIGSGILVPPLVALPVIVKAARISVREAISDNGVGSDAVQSGFVSTVLGKIFSFSLTWTMALRNMFRRRGRLYLALALLSIGGGMFIAALNVGNSWNKVIDRIYTDRSYDVEFILDKPTSEAKIKAALGNVPKIKNAEFWGYSATAVAQKGKIDISRTYPDGGHGSFYLMGTPADTTMISHPLMEGRWLKKDDTDAIVLNQIAKAMLPTAKIGDQVLLSHHGEHKPWQLVGIVEEIGSSAAAYVTDSAFDTISHTFGDARMIRLETQLSDPAAREALIRKIDKALQQANISVEKAVPLSLLKTSMGEHVIVLIATLILAAVLLAIIGLLGLMSTMSMNVLERTRELGIIKVSGATPSVISKIIVNEGVFIAITSWVLALILSLPLSLALGAFLGEMSFKTPLGLNISWFAVFLWLVLVIVMSSFASFLPGRSASKMAVHEAISYG
ncbi:hypothetical protein MNBD_UNCLBAC01-1776 [hydrothermal vent metagenome]|uniref:ABC3 transporter permease protein domain-containing protein n=1 Tax=hydrothermal vent metagenome TaxID=652676 RepID=A0A3B1D2P8_9ZZZZ